MRSTGKRKLKSEAIYETRDNQRIIEDEIQGDECQADSGSLVDSNLKSVKIEKLEEVQSFFVITEYEQRNASPDRTEVTSLITDEKNGKESFLDYDSTGALVKVKNEIEEMIPERFQLNESGPDSSQNDNSDREAASFKISVKIEPELQIDCSGNFQQEREFDTSPNIKESDLCNKNQETNSNSSSETVKEFEPLDNISYICPECGESLETPQARLWHLSEQHKELTNPNPFPSFKCKLCGIMRASMSSLIFHIRSVHNCKKPYICTICGVAIASKMSYYAHLKTHPITFSCDYCKETFITKKERHTHIKTHFQNELLSCKICGNKFMSKKTLKVHMLVHTEDCNFSCSICNAKFLRKCNLKEHMAVHSLDSPYQCEYCDYKFKTSSRLSKHRVVVHKDKLPYIIYTCTRCPLKFALRTHLSLHMRKVHSSKLDLDQHNEDATPSVSSVVDTGL